MDQIGFKMGNDLIFEVLKDKKGSWGWGGERSYKMQLVLSHPLASSIYANVAALGAERWAGVCDYASPSCNNQWTMQESTLTV